MSDNETTVQNTQHAFLVAWGWFAQCIGLIQRLQAVHLHQKKYKHTPQTKVIEFLLSILSGLKHLQDISQAAHPLDKDQAVTETWEQLAWVDHTGVRRTLSSLSWDEARELAQVLEEVEQPLIQSELDILRVHQQRIRYDGDLTGIAVSNSSKTYPNAAFGHGVSGRCRQPGESDLPATMALCSPSSWRYSLLHAGGGLGVGRRSSHWLASQAAY